MNATGIISKVASEIVGMVGQLFETLSISKPTSIQNINTDEMPQNCLVVLYGQHNQPLLAKVFTQDIGIRDRNHFIKEFAVLNGTGVTCRFIPTESPDMAVQLNRIVFELFGSQLPLNMGNENLVSGAGVISTPKKRGRPRKDAVAVTTAIAATEGKKRGRPRKDAEVATAAPNQVEKKKRGRPKKDAAPVANTAAPIVEKKKRGRPKKEVETVAAPAVATEKKKRGRPRNSEK